MLAPQSTRDATPSRQRTSWAPLAAPWASCGPCGRPRPRRLQLHLPDPTPCSASQTAQRPRSSLERSCAQCRSSAEPCARRTRVEAVRGERGEAESAPRRQAAEQPAGLAGRTCISHSVSHGRRSVKSRVKGDVAERSDERIQSGSVNEEQSRGMRLYCDTVRWGYRHAIRKRKRTEQGL